MPNDLPPLSDDLLAALIECVQQVQARQESLRMFQAARAAIDIEIRELEDALLSGDPDLQQWYNALLEAEGQAYKQGINSHSLSTTPPYYVEDGA